MNMDPLHDERVRKYIQLCVKDLPVINYLLKRDVISNEEADPIKASYNSGTHIKATEMLLDKLLNPPRNDCFQALVDAFNAAGYPFLARLLTIDTTVIEIESDRGRIMLTQFRDDFVATLNVIDVLPSLLRKELINVRDREQVLAYLTSSGPQKAADELCDRVMTRKPPADWYCDFLEVLIENNYASIVKNIEPDIVKDKTEFKRLCKRPLISEGKQKVLTQSSSEDTEIMDVIVYSKDD